MQKSMCSLMLCLGLRLNSDVASECLLVSDWINKSIQNWRTIFSDTGWVRRSWPETLSLKTCTICVLSQEAAKSLLTVGNGFSELQQGAEGESGDVRPPPALRLLLHLLLRLDPSSRLPPLQLLVPVNHQLVQLHKHLHTQKLVFVTDEDTRLVGTSFLCPMGGESWWHFVPVRWLSEDFTCQTTNFTLNHTCLHPTLNPQTCWFCPDVATVWTDTDTGLIQAQVCFRYSKKQMFHVLTSAVNNHKYLCRLTYIRGTSTPRPPESVSKSGCILTFWIGLIM